jgi:hypothetical protein
MALIFCEGFNEYRTINSVNYPQLDEWTTTGSTLFNDPRSGGYAFGIYTATTTQGKLQLDLAAFGGPHTGKKLYVGFAVKNLASLGGVQEGTTSPRRLVTFLNAAGAEVLQINVKKEETLTDLNMKFTVAQAGAQFAEYTLSNFFPGIEYTTGGDAPQQVFRVYLYIEFEIDLVNKTFALRVEGVPKNVTGTSSNLSNFPTTISDISTFQFYGTRGVDTYIDDFYVADSLAASGLQATLSVGSNIVTLKNGGSTLGLAVGQTISLSSGSAGAFGTPATPDTLAIASISDSTRFVVNANHVTAGAVTFNVIDPAGTGLNTWYGPCRIHTPFLNGDQFLDSNDIWSANGNAKLDNNDYDATNSYVVSGTVGKKQLISCSTGAPPFGATITIGEEEYIAAVQLNTVIRKTNQDTAIKPIYKSATNTYHDVGAGINLSGTAALNYKTRLFVIPKNPATNATWELAAIVDGSAANAINNGFGVELIAPT